MQRLALLVAVVVCGCGPAPTGTPPTGAETRRPADGVRPLATTVLHNAFRVSDRVYSGSGPEGEAAFAELERLGVKSVISVDGAKPDVEAARRHGLTYVHLPVGYDGVSREKVAALVRAAETLPGPVYVHCHHGKHRGPAAVAVIQLCTDPAWDADTAEAWLKAAGTDPKYAGLVAIPRSLVKPSPEELSRVPRDLPAVSPVADFTRLMVDVDTRWDRLKLVKAAGWKAPENHPDVDPPHEAVQLAEHYREAQRLDGVKRRGAEFVQLLTEAEAAAGELEQTLRQKPVDGEKAGKAFARSSAGCVACHDRFRDRPR